MLVFWDNFTSILWQTSPFRPIKAQITDETLLQEFDRIDDIEDFGDRIDKKLDVASKWPGFVQVTCDITNEYNEIEQFMREKYNSDTWIKGDEMDCLKMVIEDGERKWYYKYYVKLGSENVLKSKFVQYFDIIEDEQTSDADTVRYILSFCNTGDIAPVCQKWQNCA